MPSRSARPHRVEETKDVAKDIATPTDAAKHRNRTADPAYRCGNLRCRSDQAVAATGGEGGARRLPEMEGRLLSQPASRSYAARRDGAAIRRADDRSRRARPSRRLSRNLFGRQKPARQRKPQGANGDAVDRLARR